MPTVRPSILLLLLLLSQALAAQNCELLCNGDLEEGTPYQNTPYFIHESDFPCWSTTASDGIIEVWSTPSYEGAYAYSGIHFVELNAYEASSLYQDFTAAPGGTVDISFAHRARWYGQDVMSVEVGHDGTFVTVATVSDDSVGWGHYTYTHALAAGGSNTFTLRFTAISTGSGDPTIGNFLDAISIEVPGARPDVSLTSTGSCTDQATGTVTAAVVGGTAPFTYAWGGGGSGSSLQDLVPGTYSVTVTDDNGCTDTASVVVPGFAVPTVTLTSTALTCNQSGDGTATATVTGGTAPHTYAWSPTGGTAATATGLTGGNYTCTVSDAHGCTDAGTIAVPEPQPLVVALSSTVVCQGDPFTLQPIISGGTPAYALQWSPEGPAIQPDTTGTYSVTVTDAHGCTAPTASATITVPEFPTDPFTANTTEGCLPFCTIFHALPAPGLLFTWDFGDGGTATGTDPAHCYTVAGTYDVSLTMSTGGCSSTLSEPQMMLARAAPIAQFSASAVQVTVDEPIVDFTDESLGAVDRLWQFGDDPSDISTDPAPSFRFAETGCWDVRLFVTDQYGCTDADSTIICVEDLSTVFVPNTFTPDNDDINDEFRVVTSGREDGPMSLSVFDRWGRLLFAGDGVQQGWDGSGVGSGIYAWKFKWHDAEGFSHERFGHVTLLR